MAHISLTQPASTRGATAEEIEAVYRARYPQLLRVARAIAGDADAAHDAVQEGIARALRGRAGFRGSGPLEAWIWRAVVNAARSARPARVVRALHDEPGTAGEDADAGDLRAAVAALPERQRLAVFLRHYADLDYAAIADALDVAPGTVGATLSAAYASLRARLEETDQ